MEGQDDKHVIKQICGKSPPMPDFCIVEKGGVEQVIASIEAESMVPGRRALGIMVDANNQPSQRWQAVSDRLRKASICAPKSPDKSGTIIDNRPRIGVWMMPDNASCGELENLIEEMIPCTDAVWPLSKDYIDGIPLAKRNFEPGKTLRAQVHAWLAAREEPRKMGAAIGAGDLDVGVPLAAGLADWLRTLFA
ncbi:MAG: hypothetical protein OXC31_25115 [Spirochaetaceae bacterium]|nr:hypothetical protein [Spirochaetaceae bacterium]